jgi:hypothetical protein
MEMAWKCIISQWKHIILGIGKHIVQLELKGMVMVVVREQERKELAKSDAY